MRASLFLSVLLLTVPNTAEAFRCAVSAQGSMQQATSAKGAGLGSERTALVLFAGFAGGDPALPAWADSLFEPQRPGSVAHFYDEMSGGRLTLRGKVAPRRYLSTRSASAFVDPTSPGGGYGEFVLELLSQVDADVDFADFDSDDDGVVDLVYIITPELPQRFIAGGATGVANLGFDAPFHSQDLTASRAPMRIDAVAGTFQVGRTFAEAAGVIAHETGHLLGLPDFFNTKFAQNPTADPAQDSAGIGAWGLMGWGATGWNGDDGPAAFSAWSRLRLGWTQEYTPLEPDEEIQFVPPAAGGHVVRLPLSSIPREHFLLEYRTRASSFYDRNIPGEGLLIWHLIGDFDGQMTLDLESADGRWSDAGFPLGTEANATQGGDNLDFWAHDETYSRAHGGNLGDATDPFTTGSSFTPDTNPASRSQDGRREVRVDNIVLAGDRASARVRLSSAKLVIRGASAVSSGQGNVLFPGDQGTVQVRLGNEGGMTARDVRVTVRTTDSSIRLARSTVSFRDIDVGGLGGQPIDSGPLSFIVDEDADRSEISMEVLVESSNADPLQTILTADVVPMKTARGIAVDPDGVPVPMLSFFCGAHCRFTTDADGRFELQTQAHRLSLNSSVPTRPDLAPFAGNLAVSEDMRVVIPWLFFVGGIITDEAGQPVPDVEVTTFIGFPRVQADSSGRYELPTEPGKQTIVFHPSPALIARGYASHAEVIVAEERQTSLDIEFRRSTQVSLQAHLADGRPARGRGVVFQTQSPTHQQFHVDTDGSVRFSGGGGVHEVILSPTDVRDVPFSWIGPLDEDELVWRLPAVERIHGQVTSPGGQSVHGVLLFRHLAGHFLTQATLQAGGRFDVMAPAGNYALTFVPDDFRPFPAQKVSTTWLPDDQARLDLRLGEPSRVRVVEDDLPVGDRRIAATSVDGKGRALGTVGIDGLAVLSVIPGQYRLTVVDQQNANLQLADTVLLGGAVEPVVDVSRRMLSGIVRVDDAYSRYASVTVEATDDPLRITRFVSGRMDAGHGEVSGVQPLTGRQFELPIPESSRYIVAIWSRTRTGQVVPIPAAGSFDLMLRVPDALLRLYGNIRGNSDDLQHEITLRFYDERTGTIVQSIDSFARQAMFHLEGRQYAIGMPPGIYRVRAGIRSETAGFLRQYDLGSVSVHQDQRWDVDLHDAITAVTDESGATPRATRLSPAYPNPFNQSVVVPFETAADGTVVLTVYNLLGQRVRELARSHRAAGEHKIAWDGTDDTGRAVGTGVFIITLHADSHRLSQKVLLLR